MSYPQPAPGTHTLAEILSQPRCWDECLAAIEADRSLEKIRDEFSADGEWLFTGCGSSYYLALAAAASWRRLTGLRATAVPASELLLFPDVLFNGCGPFQPVVISRSGSTSEAVQAASYLESKRQIRSISVTCAEGKQLDGIASATLRVLPADEESTVMTRSFTSMLLAIQALGAFVGGRQELSAALRRLPLLAQRVLDEMQPAILRFVGANSFADYVFLAQGPLYGIASEAHLKVKEMSCSFAQVYHSLEFRHGPKALVGPEMLLTFLMSETGYEAEREVLEEMKALGGSTLVIVNEADDRVRAAADLLIELKLDLPEYARVAVYTMAAQLMGLYTGLKKGLDPDHPPNLSRVVILDQ